MKQTTYFEVQYLFHGSVWRDLWTPILLTVPHFLKTFNLVFAVAFVVRYRPQTLLRKII